MSRECTRGSAAQAGSNSVIEPSPASTATAVPGIAAGTSGFAIQQTVSICFGSTIAWTQAHSADYTAAVAADTGVALNRVTVVQVAAEQACAVLHRRATSSTHSLRLPSENRYLPVTRNRLLSVTTGAPAIAGGSNGTAGGGSGGSNGTLHGVPISDDATGVSFTLTHQIMAIDAVNADELWSQTKLAAAASSTASFRALLVAAAMGAFVNVEVTEASFGASKIVTKRDRLLPREAWYKRDSKKEVGLVVLAVILSLFVLSLIVSKVRERTGWCPDGIFKSCCCCFACFFGSKGQKNNNPTQVTAAAASPTKFGNTEAILTNMEPQSLGFSFDFSTSTQEFVVIKVVPGKQAESKGVQVGWRLVQIGPAPISALETPGAASPEVAVNAVTMEIKRNSRPLAIQFEKQRTSLKHKAKGDVVTVTFA